MFTFPESFLWGASTAAHQIEGNNTQSDWWEREYRVPSPHAQPSGDAADSLHRYEEDMDLLASRGLRVYRFSIEWARIEPEEGVFSPAMLAHYRRMIEAAWRRGLTPHVTLHHFTNPLWFARRGAWSGERAVEYFLRYVAKAKEILHGVEWICTINEPNMVAVMADFEAPNQSKQGPPPPDPLITRHLIEAHHGARELLADLGAKVGWTVANQAYHAVPGFEADMLAYQYPREDVFLEAAAGDDYIGVQAYLRTFIGEGGTPQPVPENVEKTLTGWEYFPAALGIAARHTAQILPHVPILVTENGIATADDERRKDYTFGALEGLAEAMADGVTVLGYLHWSLLDNYEWGSYEPTFGLIEVDRVSFERRPRPSFDWLGGIATTGELVR